VSVTRKNNLVFYFILIFVYFLGSCGKPVNEPDSPQLPDTSTIPVPIVDTSSNNDTVNKGWTKIKLDTDEYLYDIMFSGDTGFCMAGRSIYRSIDGGLKWEKVLSTGMEMFNIGIVDGQTMIAVSPYSRFENHSTIYTTKNGGVKFDSLDLDDKIRDVFCVSANTAYIIGTKLWKTIDGGISWQKIHSFQEGLYHSTLQFFDELTGYVRVKDGLYFTSDGGNTCIKIPCVGSDPGDYFGSIFFYDKDHGFLTDEVNLARYDNTNSSIKFYYTLIQRMNYYFDLHFVSVDTGYVTCGTMIMKTTKGNGWRPIMYTDGADLFEIHFTDSNHGWACGRYGTIYRYVKP
jgi:photosystem II stability/assembly factor-like uncharacterized protein